MAADKNALSLESLQAENQALKNQVADLSAALEKHTQGTADILVDIQSGLATDLAALKEEVAGQLSALKKDASASGISFNEKVEAPELSKTPYSVGKAEYLAKFPRIEVAGKMYTSAELHEAPNKEVLETLVKGFEKGENSFFQKVKS